MGNKTGNQSSLPWHHILPSRPLIDITITATRRPELLQTTLRSFHERCFHRIPQKYMRAIINVDPIGHEMESIKIADIVREFFPNIIFRLADTPHFGAAFKWVWSQTVAPFVFHLEEDWELLQEIDIFHLIDIIDRHPDLALLRLPMFIAGPDKMKNWSHFYPWNGFFFECPYDRRIELGFTGHPSLIRGDYVRNCVRVIDSSLNPEKQFHHGPHLLIKEVALWQYGVYGFPNNMPIIRDIGRQWMIRNQWIKKGTKAVFTQWEKTSVS